MPQRRSVVFPVAHPREPDYSMPPRRQSRKRRIKIVGALSPGPIGDIRRGPAPRVALVSRNWRIDMRENLRRPLVTPTLRGVHHLALCTDDMKATIDFYVNVLGMPLVHVMKVPPGLGTGPGNRGNPPYERVRHYFFDMGNDSLLAFFEIPKGKEPAGNR